MQQIRSFDEPTIQQINNSILNDSFDDQAQNSVNYESDVSGSNELQQLLRNIPVREQKILNVGAGGHALTDNTFNLEPCPQRGTNKTITGWSECISTDINFDVIICWGTLCFVRSLPETLVQFNNHLVCGGKLIVDVVTFTVMPLAQTAHPDSFVKYIELFGFKLEERISFGHPTHCREGYRFCKVRDFDYRYLMIPQCVGKVNNFLWERDWFLN